MKKTRLTLLAAVFLLTTVICCAGGRAATAQPSDAPTSAAAAAPQSGTPSNAVPAVSAIPEWTLTIVTPNGEKLFSSTDAAALNLITMEATLRNSRGEESTNTYTGVKLADVLRAVGVSNFTGLSIIAADDFSVSYTRDLALADDTLIAWEVDGEVYTTEPPLRMAPKQGVGNQYIRQPVKIVIN